VGLSFFVVENEPQLATLTKGTAVYVSISISDPFLVHSVMSRNKEKKQNVW
jgi:hypothetical protein